MTLRRCDGPTFLRAVTAAVATLERHAAEVDSLNVFPVPDGDTGRNLLVTMRGAVAEAGRLGSGDRSLGRVAEALAHGSLMSARGNSGVIASQLLRGMAEAFAGRQVADAGRLAAALRAASRAADAAVRPPVEGTILSVARAVAEAAESAAAAGRSLAGVLADAVEAAARAVARTPGQLPVLADAGVVDAGGRGLELLLRGALVGTAEGMEVSPTRSDHHAAGAEPTDPAGREAGPEGDWGYETMYLVEPHPGAALDLERMREDLGRLGESVLVIGDQERARVHLHSGRPDVAIGYGLRLGTLRRITVENLDALSAGEREERAAALLGVEEPSMSAAPVRRGPASSLSPFAVVAVAAGAGIETAFRAAGAGVVVPAGGGLAASTGELLDAIRAAGARAVAVLPNHTNARLAAAQAAELAADVEVHVVPTRNAAEGLAAVLAIDPRAEAPANAARMAAAAAALRSVAVTTVARAARLDGRAVDSGDAIAVDADGRLLAHGPDRVSVALDALRTLAAGRELVTIHAGRDVAPADLERLVALVQAQLPDLAVEGLDGGQPHQAFLVAVE